MTVEESQNIFPRKLTGREQRWLFLMLPADRPVYKQYRDKISNLKMIGNGRFGNGNYILGKEGDQLDFTAPSSPVLATGAINCKNVDIDVSIHEEFEEQIEIDLDTRNTEEIPEDVEEKGYWTFSEWLPGKKAPRDNSEVREIHLIKNSVVIAIAPKLNRIWVYEKESGINHLIPVTNFYNEIMLLKNERDPKIALNSKRLFTHLNEFTDDEIGQGFLMYNRYLNKIKLDYSIFQKETSNKKKSFFSFFKRRKN